MIIKHRDRGEVVIEEVISYDATDHDWWLYVVDYNIECMNVEMHIIP